MHKGTALATYAARCIENEILMSIRSEKRQATEISLYDAIGTDRDGNDISLAEVLGSDPSLVCDEVEARLAAEQLRRLIRLHLSDRERLVIELRYGLAGRFCMTQREIEQMLDISRSYVSRIEKKALCKLNHAFRA
jgi:RNA polymerase sporulation-specific sigma factor